MEAARRILQIQDPVIPIVGRLVNENPGTISLGQGVVSYQPPVEARRAAEAVWEEPANHLYGSVSGMPLLLEVIRQKLADDNNIICKSEQEIVVTAGSNMAFNTALLAVADIGEEIILFAPYYFNHEMAVRMAGCIPVFARTDEHYRPDLEHLESLITTKTKAIVTISPNNPTGAVYSRQSLEQISRLCVERGLYHISDEAYEYFTYEGERHYSPASDERAVENTISLFSLSKSYGFAGWRIGYMLFPRHLEESVKKIQDTVLISAPIASQAAAAAAMQVGASYCRAQIKRLENVRRVVFEMLAEGQDCCIAPLTTGAFYVLVKGFSAMNSMELLKHLVKNHGVAAIPGSAFGLEGPYLRISYGALKEETVEEGIARLIAGLRAAKRLSGR